MAVAVIGAGLAGSAVVMELVEAGYQGDIHIYDPQPEQIGRGQPFIQDSDYLLLNTDPFELSANPDNAKDFEDWLVNYPGQAYASEGMVYRAIYGDYIRDYYGSAYQAEAVQIINASVDGLCQKDGDFYVSLANQWQDQAYEAVFACIGTPAYRDAYGLKDQGLAHYIHDPYPTFDKLKDIPSQARIGILGSGASAIDMIRYFLFSADFDRELTLFVRSSLFKSSRIPFKDHDRCQPTIDAAWIDKQRDPGTGRISLDTITKQVEADLSRYGASWQDLTCRYQQSHLANNIQALKEADQALAMIQDYLSVITPLLPDLYNALTASDQARYRAYYHEGVEMFRSSIPTKTIEKIIDSIENGKLRIFFNTDQVKFDEVNHEFIVIDKDRLESRVDYLVNTTGFENDLSKLAEQSPLIKQLLDHRIILPHHEGLDILVNWPAGQVVNQLAWDNPHFYWTGNLIFSTQLGNNNAQMTMQRGRAVARHFLETF